MRPRTLRRNLILAGIAAVAAGFTIGTAASEITAAPAHAGPAQPGKCVSTLPDVIDARIGGAIR